MAEASARLLVLLLCPETKQKEQQEIADYTILYYEIYKCPKCPADNGTYFGKTPVLEQAETIVTKARESGNMFFAKAVCSDGKKRYML